LPQIVSGQSKQGGSALHVPVDLIGWDGGFGNRSNVVEILCGATAAKGYWTWMVIQTASLYNRKNMATVEIGVKVVRNG